MKSLKREFLFASMLLLSLALLFSFGACKDEEAFDEEFQAIGAGLTISGSVTNTCKFGEGKFNDSNCRFRRQGN